MVCSDYKNNKITDDRGGGQGKRKVPDQNGRGHNPGGATATRQQEEDKSVEIEAVFEYAEENDTKSGYTFIDFTRLGTTG